MSWREITVDQLRERIKRKGAPLHLLDDFDELLITVGEDGMHFIMRGEIDKIDEPQQTSRRAG